jgi:hypothetical protein
VANDPGGFVIIEPGAAQGLVGEVETERFYQVELSACVGTETDDIPCIGGDFLAGKGQRRSFFCSVFKGACHNGKHQSARRRAVLTTLAASRRGGAGGHDVIDEQYAPGAEVGLALKRAAHVAGLVLSWAVSACGEVARLRIREWTIQWQFHFCWQCDGQFLRID